MSPIVEVRGVRKLYSANGSTTEALRGIDLTIGAGEFVAVTGPSGSGKSTLLHLLGALDLPTAGEVLIDGTPLSGLSRAGLAALRGRTVGFVFQLFNLVAGLSVEENVALPALIAGLRARNYRERADELLRGVGLADKRDRLPSQLSGGEMQRVAIARALLLRPSVVLADEPTGNLDSRTGAGIMDLLSAYQAEGQTIVLVTHDLRVAARAERVVALRDGLKVADTSLAAVADRRRTISELVDLGPDERA